MRIYYITAFIIFLVLTIVAFDFLKYTASPKVIIKENIVGRVTLGTGWNTWDHWWQKYIPRYRLVWNERQWKSYLNLLKESGGDWVRLDFYYGNTEPRNDNDDPEHINWDAFTFDSPRLKSLYKHLDFFQANGIDVYLTYSYLRSNHEYNADPLSGWLSKEAVSSGFKELWTRPRDEPIDRRELAENLAATTYYLIKKRGYSCIKQVALYVEPDNGRVGRGQWENVDGFRDTVFLSGLLSKLGIRDQVKILAPHTGIQYAVPEISGKAYIPGGDFDVYAVEDYAARVYWSFPQKGLYRFSSLYETVLVEWKRKGLIKEMALMEYGDFWCEGTSDPLCSYLKTLSASCLVFKLYNLGFGGVQRWSFEPIYHPLFGFGVIKVEDVRFPPNATKVIPETTIPIIKAMEKGSNFVKVPQTFEPQKLLNTNLQRGTVFYRIEVSDPTPPGKGICAVATKNREGKWGIGLVNLYSTAKKVEVVFPSNISKGRFIWKYYDASLPDSVLSKGVADIKENTLHLVLSPHSLNFLVESEER